MPSAQRTRLLTALLTFNDAVAIGALLELRHAAIRVPDQISVIGYDDVAMSDSPTSGSPASAKTYARPHAGH